MGKVFKTRRLTWAKGPPCQIKNTTKQLKVGGIRVWGFLLTRGLETPLTLKEAKMPGYYRGINKAPCVANTVSRTCLKESCFSSPLLIRSLPCLPQPAARSQITHRASDLVVGLSIQTGSVPTEDTLPAKQLPCRCELVLGTSGPTGDYSAPRPVLVPGCCCREYWRYFSWGAFHQMGNFLEIVDQFTCSSGDF